MHLKNGKTVSGTFIELDKFMNIKLLNAVESEGGKQKVHSSYMARGNALISFSCKNANLSQSMGKRTSQKTSTYTSGRAEQGEGPKKVKTN